MEGDPEQPARGLDRRAAPADGGGRSRSAPPRCSRPRAPAGTGTSSPSASARGGVGSSPDLVTRLLARLDAERLDGGRSAPVTVESEAAGPGLGARRAPLGEQWEQAQASLPADWSDLYAELELDSSDYLERGALLLAPVNPARVKGRLAYRFRVARRFGYGASGEMTQRCLQRLDGETDHRAASASCWALSDTKPVYTQGPVWYVGGGGRLMADPVSWYLIEQGWEVVGSDGETIGKIEETVGDSTHDIFDGLTVGTGLLSKPRYVPAELVGEIVEGRVALTIDKERFERLDEYQEPPPTEQVEAP